MLTLTVDGGGGMTPPESAVAWFRGLVVGEPATVLTVDEDMLKTFCGRQRWKCSEC